VAKLHLSRRAINALEKAGVTTLGRLIKRAEAGIIGVTGLGQFKGWEIVVTLDALARRDGRARNN
jgi:DNA-directed RNA polymerase alpha subunit